MLLILSHLSSSRTGCFCGCDTSSLELPTNLPALLHHVSAHICLLLSLLRTDAVAHPGGQALNGWDQQDTLQKKPSRPFQTCQGKLSSILKVFEKSKTAFHGQGKKQGRGGLGVVRMEEVCGEGVPSHGCLGMKTLVRRRMTG